jgi:hypothetical protein
MERVPTADQLLHVWEQGRSQTPVQRARSLLALAAPGTSAEDLARYGIGRRDQELLRLYERIFGPLLMGVAQCPACGQEVELDFLAADLWPQRDPDSDQLHVLQLAGYDMSFRLPTCDDLAALDPRDDAPAQRASLLRRCIAEVRLNGEAAAADTLPEALTTALSGRMAELDPQGDIQLALSCPRCAHLWQAPLDIASYLWSEIHVWAGRMLRDVHALAAAYGWREADILAMSPWRRQAYLEMIRQ